MKKQNGKRNCHHGIYSRLFLLPGVFACCGKSLFVWLLFLAPLLLSAPLNAQIAQPAENIWKIDLLDISEQIDVRYYIGENEGRIPPKYLLINNICFFPNFLQSEFDLRAEYIEYDAITGRLFIYKVPRDYSFSRTDEREGGYYVRSRRNVDIPGMSMRSYSLEENAEMISIAGFRKSWVSDIRYNLQRDRESVRSGGLIDLNIPIKLPKQIEWLIGDGEETRLTVSGKESITIGGTSKWCANCPVTEGRPKQQKFPDLDMEQQLTVNLHGNIGEKIHVNIAHSSMGSGIGSTNRVSLNYEGLDDEIIRSIEMGDTDLTLSGAQLISYAGAAKGLFGVKVKAQLGLADITLIASKEEGESATGSYSGTGGQSSATTIADYNYIKRQYFYFETPGESFETPNPGFINSSIRYFPVIGGTANDMIEVFISLEQYELQNYQGGAKLQLRACADPENDGITGDEEDNIVQWYGILRENNDSGQGDYSLIQLIGSDSKVRYLGIRLNSPLRETKSIAVRYKSDGGFPDDPARHFAVGDYNVYPDIPENDTLLAELICPESNDQSDPKTKGRFWSTWNMMFRNIYSMGSAGLADGALKVRIDKVSTIIGTKDIQKDTGINFMQIFGIDQENTEGVRVPDDLIDDKKGIINYYYGYIQFPWFEPFKIPKSQLVTYLDPAYIPDPFYVPSATAQADADSVLKYLELNEMIYLDYVKEGLTSPPNYFDIVIETSSGSRTFQLNAFDIIQGTEVVSIDGEKLVAGTDYSIDYMSGMVTLKGDRLLTMTADSRVSIDYQHKPLVGGGKTTLLGAGANFNISSNSRMNASFLYNSVGTPRYNPRLGDEPTRTMAADVNGSFQFYPQWMTSLVNLLPRVNTDAKSSMNISGEVAVSIPNPNTKGEAFVDDMEGIEDSDQVTLVRKLWYEASPPIDPLNPGVTLDPVPDANFFWYNPVRTDEDPLYKYTTSKRDLNPRLDARENSAVSSLFLKTIDPQPGDWCGVMTGFMGGLNAQTAQYLEIWVNDFTLDPENRTGVIHIDFGRIDEDFHQPELDVFDDERQIDWTNEFDTGFPNDNLGTYPSEFTDKTWNDSWNVYKGINSRVNNNYHDTEDLNRNSRHDMRNEYYSLTLDLADTALIDIQRDFPKDQYPDYWNDATKTEGYGNEYQVNRKKSWRMYRLDISKVENPSGIPPRMDAIQHMRIWVENPFELRAQAEYDGSIENMVEIAEMKFVGSRWEFDYIRDLNDETRIVSTPDMQVKIGTINNKDNPSLYYSPYSVNVEEGLETREQALLIEVENFERERSFRLMKRFIGSGQDFQQYREIQFFVRGDQELTRYDGDQVDFYLQLAYDSLNFYEVAIPLTPERAGLWNWVNIRLSDLTDMKLDVEAGQDVVREITDSVDPSISYIATLRGNPSLFQVKYLFSGLRNRSGVMIPRGQVWFNDLALGNVRKGIDHAERLGVSTSFGNILTMSGGWQHSGPEFRSLGQRSGSGASTNTYNMNLKTELNHIIPTARFQLPVTFRYTRAESKPKYLPQKDVEITDPAAQDSLKAVKNNYSLSVSLSRRGSKNPVMKNIFDNMKAGFSYTKNASFSPTAKDTSWGMSGNANYQVQFNRDRDLSLFKGVKWRYWLTSLSMKANGARSVKRGYSFNGEEFVERPEGYSCAWNNELSTIYDPFESLKFSYRRSEDRNLAIENKLYGVDVGRLTSLKQSMDMRYQPRPGIFLISEFNPVFEYRTSYEENLKPGVRQGDDPEGTRDVYGKRDIGIDFDFDIGKYAIKFGKLVGVLDKNEMQSSMKLSNQRSAQKERKAEFERLMEDRMTTNRKADKPEGEQFLLSEEQLTEQQPGQTGEGATPEEVGSDTKDLSGLGLKRPLVKPGSEEVQADTSVVDTLSTGNGIKKPDPKLFFKHLFRFVGRFDAIKSSIDISRNNQYERLFDRADFAYQMGLSPVSGTGGAFGDEEASPQKQSSRMRIDFRSGVGLTDRISANFKLNWSQRTEESDTRITKTDDTTWPDVSLSWKGVENWPMLKKYIKTSDITVNYVKQTTKREGEETSGFRIVPNWNLVWKNSLSSNISVSYFKKTTIERNQEMWEKSWSVSTELKYDIKGSQGFGLPLPFLSKKKLKFESNLTTTLNIIYSLAEKYNVPATTSLSVSPRMSYSFSRSMTGNLAMTYRRSAGGIYGYVNHEVGLHATAEFKF